MDLVTSINTACHLAIQYYFDTGRTDIHALCRTLHCIHGCIRSDLLSITYQAISQLCFTIIYHIDRIPPSKYKWKFLEVSLAIDLLTEFGILNLPKPIPIEYNILSSLCKQDKSYKMNISLACHL